MFIFPLQSMLGSFPWAFGLYLPPLFFTKSAHFSRSILISPEVLSTEIKAMPLLFLKIVAFTLPEVFNGITIFFSRLFLNLFFLPFLSFETSLCFLGFKIFKELAKLFAALIFKESFGFVFWVLGVFEDLSRFL